MTAPDGDASPPVLDRLRAETRAAHDALERSLDPERRMRTPAAYRSLLALFHGFHASWEPAVAAALGHAAFLGPRRRLHLLAADLRHLGLDEAAIAALPRPLLPPFPSRAAAIGSLYVLEGSTLGGQVIARHLRAALGLGPGAACAYYLAHGPATGAMWRETRAVIAAAIRSPGEADEAVGGALMTFGALQGWLSPQG